MRKIGKSVFISYRRRHVAWALAINHRLIHDGYDVFFDYNSIGQGDFGQVIEENIKARDHFLVLLAPSSLEEITHPKDWFRKEIELAIEYKRNIVPVFLEGFDFGSQDSTKSLTGNLSILTKYNGLSLPAEYFDQGMDRLCNFFLNIPVIDQFEFRTRQLNIENEFNEFKAKFQLVDEKTLKKIFASTYYEKAYSILDIEEKIRLYTISINYDPLIATTYNMRGNCYAIMEKYSQAIFDYNRAISINPKYKEALLNRGKIYLKLDDKQKAIDDFDKLNKIISVE